MKENKFIGNLNFYKKCTGCMACVDVCPAKCIDIKEAADSFLYPEITKDIECINCGKCVQVCPVNKKLIREDKKRAYACHANEKQKRNAGSSGGVFGLLAEYFLANGYYVCGAAFDGDLKLKHKLIASEKELAPLLKSKYIQSNTLGIFKQIITLLNDGKKVFFCGTPCQVSALINSTSKKNLENLFTADIVCHGVPSQKLFDEYIKSLNKKHNAKICEFNFRVKDNHFRHSNGFMYKCIRHGKNKTVNGIFVQSWYYYAFKKYATLRESCYNCEYANSSRVSDITLGDFWGVEKIGFKSNTDEGCSVVLVNSLKGNEVFNKINELIAYIEVSIETAINTNPALRENTKKPDTRDEIYRILREEGFDNLTKKVFVKRSTLKHRILSYIPMSIRQKIKKG